jgi:hypothetical protein
MFFEYAKFTVVCEDQGFQRGSEGCPGVTPPQPLRRSQHERLGSVSASILAISPPQSTLADAGHRGFVDVPFFWGVVKPSLKKVGAGNL